MSQQPTLSPVNSDPVIDPDKIVNLELIPHTIYVLCGPTMSGKSTFTNNLTSAALEQGLTAVGISSDAMRAWLMQSSGPLQGAFNMDEMEDRRHSPAALSVSKQAFEMLFTTLKSCVAFPVCTEIIVVDTTGFDERFREDICNIAKNNNYKTCLVTFDYKNRSDYVMDGFSEQQGYIVDFSVGKFRKKILPNLKAAMFDSRIRVKTRYSDIKVTNADFLKHHLATTRIAPDVPVAIIGDSHEHVEALDELIEAVKEKHPTAQIVHVGDFVDKGGNTLAAVDYMWDRVTQKGDILLAGNHEAYVAKRLLNEISAASIEPVEFTSVAPLQESPSHKAKFLTLEALGRPFLVLDYSVQGGTPVYVTHAPCRTNELGKITGYCIRNQRNYRIIDREKSVEQDLEWLYKDSESIWPLHVFGHVTHMLTKGEAFGNMVYKNRVFLDTGAVYGGQLSAAIIQKGKLTEIVQVQAKPLREKPQPFNLGRGPKKEAKPFSIHDYELDVSDLRLLRQIKENEVQYISGTMSPGPSTQTEIEPLEAAFDYLAKAGATKVMLQPKWMGSRAQLYLFEGQPEKTFLVSRGGWKIRKITGLDDEEFKAFVTGLHSKYSSQMKVYGDMILDGELMPWSALGEGLIKQAFTPYMASVVNELLILAKDDYLHATLPEFCESLNLFSKGDHITAFNEVLGRYSKLEQPAFKAFSILKTAKEDRENPLKDEADKFISVCDWSCNGTDMFFMVELADEGQRQRAKDFFKRLTVDQGMEGVVLKPTEGECEIPYMKVRSEEYLRLVYGYDWMDRRDRLCWQKNISGKVRLSVKEHKLAQAMLMAAPEAREEFAVKMIGSMKEERGLDPRL